MTDKVNFDDLTKINVPFGLLDDDTKDRLRAWGGEFEMFGSGGWIVDVSPFWRWFIAYRAKPQPLTKPYVDPDHLADWVNGIARDEGGLLWALGSPRQPHLSYWDSEEIACLSAFKIDPGTCDWKDSLVSVKELRAIKREKIND